MITSTLLAAALMTQVSEFAALSPEGAAAENPCCVTGVVTFVSGWRERSFVIADPRDVNGPAVYVRGELNNEPIISFEGFDKLVPGQVIEVKGVSERLSFAPGMTGETASLLGLAELPEPPLRRLRELDGGLLDNQRVRLSGVLAEVTLQPEDPLAGRGVFTRLLFLTPDGEFAAHLPGDVTRELMPLVDAELDATGIAMSFFSLNGVFLGVQLQVDAPQAIRLVKRGSSDPYALPVTALEVLSPYSRRNPDGHRKHVRGVVTSVTPGSSLTLQEDAHSLLVLTHARDAVVPGDEVDAVGFPSAQDGKVVLKEAGYRRTGNRLALPEPLEMKPEYLGMPPSNGHGGLIDLSDKRVRLTARLLRLEREESGDTRLLVLFGSTPMTVRLAGDVSRELASDAALEPRLELTGVLKYDYESGLPKGRVPTVTAVSLVVASKDDIRIISDASLALRRQRRFFSYLTYAGIAALAAGLILLALRLVRSRRAAEKMQAVLAERKRMAGDLHDTIEQNLASARMLLRTSVLLAHDVPESVKEAISSVAGILANAKAEIRETVFNLRSDEVFSQPPEKVFRDLAKRLSAHGVLKVKAMFRGLPEKLPGALFSDLLFIVQEAVTNAVKHGHAKMIILTIDPLPESEGNGFVVRVANDGEPFDPNRVLGPEAGHFGLVGMRERATRNAIGFVWETPDTRPTLRLTVKL